MELVKDYFNPPPNPQPPNELKPFNLFVITKTNLKLLFHKFNLGLYYFLNDTEIVIFGLKLTARLGEQTLNLLVLES